MYQCGTLEEGRLNSCGNHSHCALEEPLLSGRHIFPPQREPETIQDSLGLQGRVADKWHKSHMLITHSSSILETLRK